MAVSLEGFRRLLARTTAPGHILSVMRSTTVLRTLGILAVFVTSTTCESASSPSVSSGASGSIAVSGAITATLTAGAQHASQVCAAFTETSLPPARNTTVGAKSIASSSLELYSLPRLGKQ